MQHAIIYAANSPRCLPCPIFNAAIDVDDDDDDGDGNGNSNAAKCNNLIAACQAEATQVQHENEEGGRGGATAAGREEGNVNPILLRPSSFFCSLRRRHFN